MSSNPISTPAPSRLAPCSLRPAQFSDYQQLAALQSRYGLAIKTEANWRRLWLDNPAYRELHPNWTPGWVLENVDGRIVGYLGSIPLIYLFRGTRLRVSTSYAWVVAEEYRSFSLWLMEEYFQQKDVDLYINNSVSDQAAEGYGLFGSSKVPVGAWDQTAFAITSPRGFAESVLRRKQVPLPKLLSVPAALGLLGKYLQSRRIRDTHGANGSTARPEFCATFDARFDRFWQELRERSFDKLLAVRSRDVLEWHFAEPLADRTLWIVACGDSFRITAYAVFARHDKPEYGLKRVQLVDFQSLDGSRALLPAMLAMALERCRREGVHMLEYFGFHESEEQIAKLLPERRPLPSWLYYYQAMKKDLAVQLADPKVWTPFTYDGDLTL